jgi:hypothetical protein
MLKGTAYAILTPVFGYRRDSNNDGTIDTLEGRDFISVKHNLFCMGVKLGL